MNLDPRSSHKELDLSGHTPSMTGNENRVDSKTCVLEHPVSAPVYKKRTKTTRCNHGECRKKLSIVDISMGHCKCSKVFCQTHRDNSDHQCSYDWHTNAKSELVKQLLRDKCVNSKTEQI